MANGELWNVLVQYPGCPPVEHEQEFRANLPMVAGADILRDERRTLITTIVLATTAAEAVSVCMVRLREPAYKYLRVAADSVRAISTDRLREIEMTKLAKRARATRAALGEGSGE